MFVPTAKLRKIIGYKGGSTQTCIIINYAFEACKMYTERVNGKI